MQTIATRAVVRVTSLLAAALSLSMVSVAASPVGPDDSQSLKTMSLEDLGNIEITSVSKEPESVRRTPAAIYVITQDDIRRSGATTLPEILRLAPGLDVARIDTTHWSVGVRGFGDQFSKSVLVMIDGRSAYTPLFAGVMWAVQVLPFQDIERIEIIRGPGGTIWGANAVNGVINIVTKSAAETHGVSASATSGNIDRAIGTASFGGRANGLDYRVYGKALTREPQKHSDGQTFDTWKFGVGGGRMDWSRGRDSVTISADVYDGRLGQSVSLGSLTPPSQIVHYEPLETSGANVVALWRRALANSGSVQVQAYVDRTRWMGPQLGETRHTFDVDFLHQRPLGPRQSLTWGAGARISPNTVVQTVQTLDVAPHDQKATIASAFAQDEITIVPDRVAVTVGAKLERYTYTGLEVQPSIRALWTPTTRHSFWGSVTRAVRTPSRLERDFSLMGYLGVANGLPTYVRVVGAPDFDSEALTGYEAGYRMNPASSVYLDVATFYNQHDKLESFGASTVLVETSPAPLRAVLQFPYANGVEGTSHGVELVPTWKPSTHWQLRGFYTYLRIDVKNRPGHTDASAVTTYEGSSPRHQVQVQSLFDLPGGFEFDQTVRRVSALPARSVDAYTSADLRFAWRASDRFTLSAVGTNLLDDAHAEFGHDPGPIVEIRRAFSVSAAWSMK